MMVEDDFKIEIRGYGKEYFDHTIFNLLEDAHQFYNFLSDRSFDFANGCLITGTLSFNSNVYASLAGTIESIQLLSLAGRLNDAFALARKFEDAVLIDIYKTILLNKEESKLTDTDCDLKDILDDSIIRSWTRDTYKLFKVGDLKKIKTIIAAEDRKLSELIQFEQDPFRDICNNNVHYNSWNNFSLNVPEYLKINHIGVDTLNDLHKVVLRIFVIHFSFLYIQHPEYYSSCDYIYALEEGRIPVEGSQYWVASIVQDVFDRQIKLSYKGVAEYLAKLNLMELE